MKNILATVLILIYLQVYAFGQQTSVYEKVSKDIVKSLSSYFDKGLVDFMALDAFNSCVIGNVNPSYSQFYDILNDLAVSKPTPYLQLVFNMYDSVYVNATRYGAFDLYVKDSVGMHFADTASSIFCRGLQKEKIDVEKSNIDDVFKIVSEKYLLKNNALVKLHASEVGIGKTDNAKKTLYAFWGTLAKNCESIKYLLINEINATVNRHYHSFSSKKYLDKYYKDLLSYYIKPNKSQIARYWPSYNNYSTQVDSLINADLKVGKYQNTLTKLPTGKWELVIFLLSDKSESKNQYYAQLHITYNELAAIPVIQSVDVIKPTSNEKYYTDTQFKFYLNSKLPVPRVKNSSSPPPPPPPPPPKYKSKTN